MANVGTLTVELQASIATFQSDLGKAVAAAESSSRKIGSAFSGIGKILAGIGIGVSAHAFVELIKGSIDAQDHLQNLSQATGVAIETLGGLGLSAKQSGTDLDGVANAFKRLNVNIAAASEGDVKIGKAFTALGISLDSLKNSSPEQTLAKIADKFQGFEDGPNKAAIASELFGKSYQSIIPLLNQGGEALRSNVEYFTKYSGVTAETAKKAKEFNETLEKAKLLSGAFGNTLAAELLPSLQALVDVFVEAKEKGDGFGGIAGDVAAGLKGVAVAAVASASALSATGHAIGAVAAAAAAAFRGEGALASQILKEGQADAERALERALKIIDAINNPKVTDKGPSPSKIKAPGLGSADRDDTSKRILDQQIKALEDSIKYEEEVLKNREHFLGLYYQDDQIGIRDYFDRRQSAIDDAFQKESAAYTAEIEVLRAFAAKASPKDRIDTETRISDVIAKQAKLQRDYQMQGKQDWIDQRKAAEAFRSKIEDIALQLAQLSGDTVTAGLFNFDKTNAEFKKRSELEAQSTDETEAALGRLALKELDSARTLTSAQLQRNKVQKSYTDTMEDLSILTGRIDLQQQTGALTEIEAINKKSATTRSYIATLQALADEQDRIASALPIDSPVRADALRQVQRLRLEIDQLAASADALQKKFNDIFTGAVADGLTELITGAKTVKQAFQDMERSIVQSISRIASQNIAESIFGKSGPLSSAGGIFASFFGGSSGPEQLSGPTGGGFSDILGKLAGLIGFAGGTDYAPGGLALVGEKGPELVNLPRGAQVTPNSGLKSLGQSLTIVNNVTVMPGANRTTADQAAMQVGVHTQRALARNG